MKKLPIALATAASLALAACGAPAEDADTVEMDDATAADTMANDNMAAGNLVEVAQGNEDFSTLVSAVTAAGLGDALSGDGPLTVFAPNNAAFDKLPDGTLESLTTDQTDQLGTILQYHVVEGSVDAATLTQAIADAGEEGYTIKTLGGGTLTAMLDGENVVLTDAAGGTATVTATDVQASNGIIHVIDTVLMPE
ncbi:fasciclin domain-containing protein [Erythrobacteraceae bacterium WH01K]|nr:fasciclin domain-containing protein [Erythrobacteraceae bacterium WH01K]